ncbi:hypothetical protein UN64_13965 [Fictibacillus arsenicus]|uniref:Uncharacterized protein n=1 Tax=Fictibacillus arsenicus TaxID=255247 RepID=A0A1V3G4V0_9BACL|nr:hypothetical protein UN64_13965 [Fictibacillus arsenicus]
MEVFLLLRLQVNAADVSFLVACQARSFSGCRHAPCAPINLQMMKIEKAKSNNPLEKSVLNETN